MLKLKSASGVDTLSNNEASERLQPTKCWRDLSQNTEFLMSSVFLLFKY